MKDQSINRDMNWSILSHIRYGKKIIACKIVLCETKCKFYLPGAPIEDVSFQYKLINTLIHMNCEGFVLKLLHSISLIMTHNIIFN